MGMLPAQDPCALRRMVNNARLTGYETNFVNDFHFSETIDFIPGVLQRREALVIP